MIEIVKINLLPYREKAQQRKKRQFTVLMITVASFGVIASLLTYILIGQAISRQEARNQFLNDKLTSLEKRLGEIQTLQQEKQDFLVKKQKVEELQDKRYHGAQIIDTLNVLTPDNTYLISLEAESPTTYKLTGRAASDNKIAIFMNALPSTGIFALPELLSIKKVENYQEFVLKIQLNQNAPVAPVQNNTLPNTNSNGQ